MLYLIGLVALIASGAMTVQTAVLALLGGGAVAFLVTLVRLSGRYDPVFRPAFSELKPMVSYSVRAMLMDAVFVVATYADRIVLIRCCRSESWDCMPSLSVSRA